MILEAEYQSRVDQLRDLMAWRVQITWGRGGTSSWLASTVIVEAAHDQVSFTSSIQKVKIIRGSA